MELRWSRQRRGADRGERRARRLQRGAQGSALYQRRARDNDAEEGT